jgi:protein-disulfide isomerase
MNPIFTVQARAGKNLWQVFLLLALSLPLQWVRAADNKLSAAELEQVKQAVMQELRDSDFLKSEIRAGILDFIQQQREQQAAAQAAQQRQSAERAKNVRRVSSSRDHIYGDPGAPVSMIEYSDFECPYCKAFHATPKQIVDQSGGRVNWVYRHFPLPFHNPMAQQKAEASECAYELGGNDGFWEFTNALYAAGPAADKSAAMGEMLQLVESIGLDRKAFEECVADSRYAARVAEDLQEGSRIGINGTPGTVLLNNENGAVQLISGAVPAASLAASVQQVMDDSE